jgi:hypothetical protein
MKKRYRNLFIALMTSILVLSTGAALAARGCEFAYAFCWPRYYSCLASGIPQQDCHMELDACILRNGCSNLP